MNLFTEEKQMQYCITHEKSCDMQHRGKDMHAKTSTKLPSYDGMKPIKPMKSKSINNRSHLTKMNIVQQ